MTLSNRSPILTSSSHLAIAQTYFNPKHSKTFKVGYEPEVILKLKRADKKEPTNLRTAIHLLHSSNMLSRKQLLGKGPWCSLHSLLASCNSQGNFAAAKDRCYLHNKNQSNSKRRAEPCKIKVLICSF